MKRNIVKLPSENAVFVALHAVLTTPLTEDMDVLYTKFQTHIKLRIKLMLHTVKSSCQKNC